MKRAVLLITLLLSTFTVAQFAPVNAGIFQTYTFTSTSTAATQINVAGLDYFSLTFIPSGTVSTCTLTVDGSTGLGQAYTSGAIIPSQTCTASGTTYQLSPAAFVLAQVTPTITGSGTVTVVLEARSFVPIIHAQLNGNPCVNPASNLQSVALNASGTTAAQIIAAITGKRIYVCSISADMTGTSPSFSLVYGTGANCGTGTTTLITAMTLTTAPFAFANPVGATPASQAVCTLLAGTTPTTSGVLTFIQQ